MNYFFKLSSVWSLPEWYIFTSDSLWSSLLSHGGKMTSSCSTQIKASHYISNALSMLWSYQTVY